MIEQQPKSICFETYCIQSHTQIFHEQGETAYAHNDHLEYCRHISQQDIGGMLVGDKGYLSQIKQECQDYLYSMFRTKLKRIQDTIEQKYKKVSKRINNQMFHKFENPQELAQKIPSQANMEELWFLNNIFHQRKESLRQGLIGKTMLMANRIGKQFEIQVAIMSDLIKEHDFKIVTKLLSPKQEEPEPQYIPSNTPQKQPLEHLQSSENSSQLVVKTKRISKRKGRSKLANESKQSSRVVQGVVLDEVEVKDKKDLNRLLLKRVRCAKLVIWYNMEQLAFIGLVNHLHPTSIIVNAFISFKSPFISKINPNILSDMIKLEEEWDYNNYFREYVSYMYFPCGQQVMAKRVSLHMKAQSWNMLPKITNIWLGNEQDLRQLQKSSIDFSQINCLRIQPCSCCELTSRLVAGQILPVIKSLNNLDTLIVNRFVFTKDLIHLICTLIDNNPNITCLVLNYNNITPNKVIEAIGKLRLNKLMITNYQLSHQKQDFSPIFNIPALQYLTLQNFKFANIGKHLSRLQNLLFLDLYSCAPIYSSILDYLHPNTHKNLFHLNLGYTDIDDNISESLKKFSSLEELNLDGTKIDFWPFLNDLKESPFETISKLSIFTYNQKKHQRQLSEQAFTMIPIVFPNLVYLMIGYEKGLKNINLNLFKKLQYFGVDSKLVEQINTNEEDSIKILISKDKSKNKR